MCAFYDLAHILVSVSTAVIECDNTATETNHVIFIRLYGEQMRTKLVLFSFAFFEFKEKLHEMLQ